MCTWIRWLVCTVMNWPNKCNLTFCLYHALFISIFVQFFYSKDLELLLEISLYCKHRKQTKNMLNSRCCKVCTCSMCKKACLVCTVVIWFPLNVKSHHRRFTSGREVKKKHTLWALILRIPPNAPSVVVPLSGPINADVLNNPNIKGRKTKHVLPTQW